MAAPMAIRGVNSGAVRRYADGAVDAPGTPDVNVLAQGPWPATGQPWLDVMEDPYAPGLPFASPDPAYPRPDVGALPIVGAYDGTYKTEGPVTGFGEEQQAVGRVQRFGNNGPDRSPGRGEGSVMDGPSYADELAAALAATGQGPTSDADLYSNLLMYR